jgi:hypothetical protein
MDAHTIDPQTRASVVPFPRRRHAGVSTELLLREGSIDVGVALHLVGCARPRPGCRPGKAATGQAIDLRALRAGA